MHQAVRDYVHQFATGEKIDILDIGGRNVNGTPRDLFPNATYTVLDIHQGTDVDIQANAAEWDPDGRAWHLILCTEVFEHTPEYPAICRTAFEACWPGGRFIVTCAGPGRASHSAFMEAPQQPGEFYENLTATRLADALSAAGWADIEVERAGLDLRASAKRP
jgi:hypothetical protein